MTDAKLKSFTQSCLKKHRYQSKEAALQAINRVHKKRDVELRIYFCKYCLGYHLTSKVLKESNNG